MGIFEWAGFGALLLGLMMFCARLMRRGLTSLDEHRAHYLENIHQGERDVEEVNKSMGADEHLRIVHSAVNDLLRLDDNPSGFTLSLAKRKIILQTPEGPWEIELLMRERQLKGSQKVLHGRSHWRLSGFGKTEDHGDIAELMASLNRHLHPDREFASVIPGMSDTLSPTSAPGPEEERLPKE